MTIVTRLSTFSGAARTGTLALWTLLLVGAVGGCGRGNRASDSAVAAGEAGPIEVDALNYEVTPERYQRWVAAQRALDAISGLPEPPVLDPARVSEADINRAIGYLESDPRARSALARAGVSARDYVLTTLALDQALVATTPTGAASPSAGTPVSSGRSTPPSRGAARSTSTVPSGGARTATSTPPSPDGARTRPRYRNLPRTNTELVERNREDIARVRSGMRFRIVKERVDTAVVERPAETAARVIPAGTTVALRSTSRVCTSKVGDRVPATVSETVTGPDGATIPAGAAASLSVVGSPAGSNQMELSLNSISFGGQTYAVAGTAVASRVDRVRVGSARKDAQKVVGGAAIGAVAGQVLGKDTKSTVIGAAVGAAAGAAAADASARYQTCIAAGAPIQLTLRDPLVPRV